MLKKHKNIQSKLKILLDQQIITQMIMRKIKFNLHDDLPLKKSLELSGIIVVVTSFFNDRNKHYPQVFLNDFFKKLTE